MKLAAVLAMALLTSCSAMTSPCDWDFMQRVGGLAIGTPERALDGRWTLPVDGDVSGARAVTVKQVAVNSALGFARYTVRRHGNRLDVTVRKNIGGNPSCAPIDLGHLAPGDYEVNYRDPDGTLHPFGTFRIQE